MEETEKMEIWDHETCMMFDDMCIELGVYASTEGHKAPGAVSVAYCTMYLHKLRSEACIAMSEQCEQEDKRRPTTDSLSKMWGIGESYASIVVARDREAHGKWPAKR